jgi:Zn-dependent protease with chaperone function
MSAPYLLRLLCLSLASFFLVNAFAGLMIWLISRNAIRTAEKMRARSAARFLFFLRLVGPATGMAVVLVLCVPSYLWLEPQFALERIGLVCLVLVVLGVAGWCISIVRTISAIVASSSLRRKWRRAGRKAQMALGTSRAVVVEKETPLLALAGVFRPQLLVSRGVLQALSNEQLDVALQHENAHLASRDNLRRLLFLVTPDAFPLAKSLASIERSWARLSEWAADDEAARGDSNRALLLAEALLRVARMGAGPRLSYLHTSLVGGDRDLRARVDRLLSLEALPALPTPGPSPRIKGALWFVVCVVVLTAGPAALSLVHRFLEFFVR